jgi:hypothetical protein
VTFPNRLASCVLALILTAPVLAQNTFPPPQSIPTIPDASQGPGRRTGTADRTMDDILRENERKLNKQRQADLKRDTDELLDLATELKKYVDKSNENLLSLEVLRKAEEIEKLAKSVKDKMKGPQ